MSTPPASDQLPDAVTSRLVIRNYPYEVLRRPATLWVPPRGNLPECWLAVPHIVSIYYAGGSVFIELPRKTVQLTYSTRDDAVKAAKCFVDAMANEPADEEKAEYPAPIGGSIRNNAPLAYTTLDAE